MPRPGTGPAEPGTAAAHLGAVVFRADPRARGGAGTFSGWRWLRRRPFRRLKLSSWSRQGNDRLRRHSAVLQQCVSRPARQLESQYCSWERTIGSRIQTPKQANKQAIALRQQTILRHRPVRADASSAIVSREFAVSARVVKRLASVALPQQRTEKVAQMGTGGSSPH